MGDKRRVAYCVQLAVEELCKGRRAIFATFTFQENVTDKKEAERRWRNLKTRIERKIPGIRGVHIWQRQKRGAWHIHAVFNQRLDVSWLRPAALACGFGTFLDLRTVGQPTGGFDDWNTRKVVSYVTRYITRDLGEEDKGARLVGYTGNARVATQRFSWSSGLSYLRRVGRGEWAGMVREGVGEPMDEGAYWFFVRLGWETLDDDQRQVLLDKSASVRRWWFCADDPF